MTIIQLREEVEKIALTLLRRLRDNALAMIDLYAAAHGGDAEGEADDLATRICGWGLEHGLIRETEHDYLHGMMTWHTRPSSLGTMPLSFFDAFFERARLPQQ